MSENQLAKMAIDIAFSIHKQYGPGLFESVYEELFCAEWVKTKIPFTRQQAIGLTHEHVKLDIGFRADIIIEGKLIIEIKSVEGIADVHFKQLLTYLRLTGFGLGLLINFNVPLLKDGIKRVVNNLKE